MAGGGEPLWAHSGRELFYRSTTGQMMAVPVTTAPALAVGTEQALFVDSTYLRAPSYRGYDVTRDDKAFVMLRMLPEIRPGEYGPAGVRGQLVHGAEGEDGEEVTREHAPDASSSLKRRLGGCR